MIGIGDFVATRAGLYRVEHKSDRHPGLPTRYRLAPMQREQDGRMATAPGRRPTWASSVRFVLSFELGKVYAHIFAARAYADGWPGDESVVQALDSARRMLDQARSRGDDVAAELRTAAVHLDRARADLSTFEGV